MKKVLISTLMMVFVCGPVFAQSSKDGTQGRTRAEVKEELAKSKHDGTQTIKNSEYPPGEQTVKRAQSEHAAHQHPNEGPKPEFDEHDKAGKPRGQGGK